MTYQHKTFEKFVSLMQQHSPQENLNLTCIENFGAFKISTTQSRKSTVDQPVMWIVGQGRKICFVGDQKYDFSAGNVLVLLYPMPVEVEVVEASPDKPFLTAGVAVDLSRMVDVLVRVDRIDGAAAKPASIDPSSIFSIPLNDNLLDPFIRLFKLLANPRDAAMLGDSIVNEIYYRLLCNERGGELRFLLQQGGEIQRISKAVAYIHQNLDQTISVEQLAGMVHMGQTAFYQNFRNVMHMSPLQYAKSVKLYEAQKLIKAGKNVNEAGYLVGYKSPAQFSREYKRHFGFAPSAT
ncbi:MAG: AraC family transcriptional regulator [Chloroflexales bacterium]|nr:AraC family transcriptional regulator [Chloroflexales bacterium]